MSTEPGQVRARSPSPEAERMRLYRKRRREAMRYVRIPLHVTEIDELVRLGFLRGEQCRDPEALQMAVLGIIYGVLDIFAFTSPRAISSSTNASRRPISSSDRTLTGSPPWLASVTVTGRAA